MSTYPLRAHLLVLRDALRDARASVAIWVGLSLLIGTAPYLFCWLVSWVVDVGGDNPIGLLFKNGADISSQRYLFIASSLFFIYPMAIWGRRWVRGLITHKFMAFISRGCLTQTFLTRRWIDSNSEAERAAGIDVFFQRCDALAALIVGCSFVAFMGFFWVSISWLIVAVAGIYCMLLPPASRRAFHRQYHWNDARMDIVYDDFEPAIALLNCELDAASRQRPKLDLMLALQFLLGGVLAYSFYSAYGLYATTALSPGDFFSMMLSFLVMGAICAIGFSSDGLTPFFEALKTGAAFHSQRPSSQRASSLGLAPAPLVFDKFSIAQLRHGKTLSCGINPGERIAILSDDSQLRKAFVDSLLDFSKPAGGSVKFQGSADTAPLRGRVAWVAPAAGAFPRQFQNGSANLIARLQLDSAPAEGEPEPPPVERGRLLRWSLIRAVKSGRPLLVVDLDEDVDAVSRNLILDFLKEAPATVFCCVSNWGQAVEFDRCIFLDGLGIHEGTHGDLLRHNPAYMERWRAWIVQERAIQAARQLDLPAE